MHKNLRALALTLLVFFAGTGLAIAKQNDNLTLKVPPNWIKGNVQEDRRSQTQIMQLIRPGDDISNWKELLTEISYPKPRGIHKPEELLDHLKALREKECRGATAWKVIAQDEESITYEWHYQSCINQAEQCEIAKILVRRNTAYFLQYAKKVNAFSPEERDTWLKWLGEAKLGD
jgi:hypothetical protein